MEPRNYLDQAKSFLAGRGAKLALRIAPLALMAAGAVHAGTITFTPVTGSVSGSCVSCSGSAFASGSASSNSVTNGISFYGAGSVFGGTGFSGGGTEGIKFSYSGTASGTGPATLNVSWDFSGLIGFSSASLGAQSVLAYNYDLLFGFNGGTPVTCSGCSGSYPANGDLMTGSGTVAVPSGAISSYTAVFDFTFNPTDEDETLSINIPAGLSIDVINPASTGVPEPSTLLLMIPGLGLFGLVARRRRHQA